MIYLYLKTHKLTGLKYLGKTKQDPYVYQGSGKRWLSHINVHGYDVVTDILFKSEDKAQIREQGIYYSNLWNVVKNKEFANLREEAGDGGDVSKFINYETRKKTEDPFKNAHSWFLNLTKEEQTEWHKKQGMTRSKGWYVSKVNDHIETYVQNIAEWCKDNGVDTGTVSGLNNPKSPLFQKQTKGWRIRRSDMPPLPPYCDKRTIGRPNVSCRGKSWKLVDGKRVWSLNTNNIKE